MAKAAIGKSMKGAPKGSGNPANYPRASKASKLTDQMMDVQDKEVKRKGIGPGVSPKGTRNARKG